jgi:hypothetical protein
MKVSWIAILKPLKFSFFFAAKTGDLRAPYDPFGIGSFISGSFSLKTTEKDLN